MAKNVPKTTANTENNVYNQHKTTTCRITDEDEKNENTGYPVSGHHPEDAENDDDRKRYDSDYPPLTGRLRNR